MSVRAFLRRCSAQRMNVVVGVWLQRCGVSFAVVVFCVCRGVSVCGYGCAGDIVHAEGSAIAQSFACRVFFCVCATCASSPLPSFSRGVFCACAFFRRPLCIVCVWCVSVSIVLLCECAGAVLWVCLALLRASMLFQMIHVCGEFPSRGREQEIPLLPAWSHSLRSACV